MIFFVLAEGTGCNFAQHSLSSGTMRKPVFIADVKQMAPLTTIDCPCHKIHTRQSSDASR